MGPRRFLVPLSVAVIAALAGAGRSGKLVPEAAAQVGKRPDEDDEPEPPLLLASAEMPSELLAHRSHSSHSSHRSHVSGRGGGGGGWGGSSSGSSSDDDSPPAYVPPPPPPKPATVSIVALPGGRIHVNGTLMGTDATAVLTLKPGSHEVRIENRYLGLHTTTVTVTEGQTGAITVDW